MSVAHIQSADSQQTAEAVQAVIIVLVEGVFVLMIAHHLEQKNALMQPIIGNVETMMQTAALNGELQQAALQGIAV